MYQRPYLAGRSFSMLTRGGRIRLAPSLRVRVPPKLAPILRRTGGTYLGEDETYYYWIDPPAQRELGGLFDNIGNMFKRMVKFTPNSFKPSNIYEGFINTTLTAASGGLYQVLPKNLKKSVYQAGKVAVPVIAGGVLAYTAGPAVWSILGPKLTAAGNLLKSGAGSMLGLFSKGKGQDVTARDYGSVTDPQSSGSAGSGILETASQSIAVGGQLLQLLGKLPQNKQAEVAERLTPEQIAYMEQTGQIPPALRGYFDQLAQQTFNPPIQAGTGAAELYNPFGYQQEGPTKDAGMLGGMSPVMMAAIGLPVLFYLMSGKR